jgi:hypothetical protein
MPPPIVLVEWLDHTAHADTRWTHRDEIAALEPTVVMSVGYVLKETSQTLTLLPHWNDSGDGYGEIVLLKSCIRKRETLKRRSRT